MKKLIIVLVILILAFIALSVWAVKVYAEPLQLADFKMTLAPETNKVFLKSGEGEFFEVTSETDLQVGDTVKTDETGEARIVLFDTNEVTLDKNSEVVIEESFLDQSTPFLTKIKLKLNQGQIWNRLFEFLHPDAYFEVEAGGVVATVRGTVFNVAYHNDEVDVSVLENAVAVARKEVGESTLLKPNEKFLMKLKEIKEDRIETLKEELKESDWFKNNFQRDRSFKEAIKEKREEFLKQVGPLPGMKMYPLKELGEKISLLTTFDKEARREKLKNFQARKILAAKLLRERGEKEKAFRLLKSVLKVPEILPLVKRFDYYDRDFLKTQAGILKSGIADGNFAKEYLEGILAPKELEFINQKVSAGEFLPPWLREILKSGPDGAVPNYLQPILTSEDLACLGRIQAKSLELQQILQSASPETLMQDSLAFSKIFTPEDFECIQRIQAKLVSLKIGEILVQPVPLEMQPIETNTNSGVTSTNTIISEPPKVVMPTLTGFEAKAGSTTIVPQGNTKLFAYLHWSDGSVKDVTASALWRVEPEAITGAVLGEVRDNVFYSNGRMGKVSVRGSYTTSDGKVFESTVVINVGAL